MGKITAENARAIADQFLKILYGPATDAVIVDQGTREEGFGWVYFYDSKEYLETGDISTMLVGNAPLIVDWNGRVYQTGTAFPPEDYIEGFRSRLEAR